MSFQERILGREQGNPVTVNEMIQRFQAFRGDAEVEISRNMVMIKLPDKEKTEDIYVSPGFLDEPVPSLLRRLSSETDE